MSDYRSLTVSELFLDEENPRYPEVNSQLEALQAIIDEQSDKVLNLATDIVDSGELNPGELFFVMEDGKVMKVLEGNRRIAAVKLLSDPSLLNSLNASTKFKNEFIALAEKFQKAPITEIFCTLVSSREEARRWIELRHTGENEGVGVVGWNPLQQDRYRAKFTNFPPSLKLQAVTYVAEYGSDDAKNLLPDLPSTSLGRLLGDPDVRKVLGWEYKNQQFSPIIPQKEAMKRLNKTVILLARDKDRVKVKDIMHKENRRKFLKDYFSEHLPGEEEQPSQNLNQDIEDKTEIKSDTHENSPTLTPISRPSAPPKVNSTKKRQTLPTRNLIIPHTHGKIQRIFDELNRINVHDYPHAAAFLMRVFLEATINYGLEKYQINQNDRRDANQKFSALDNYLKKNNLVKKNDVNFKGVRTAIDNPDDLASINTFNHYLHNMKFNVRAENLIPAWDDLEPFFEFIWN